MKKSYFIFPALMLAPIGALANNATDLPKGLNHLNLLPLALISLVLLSGCSITSTQPESSGTGANRMLPAPHLTFMPTVKIARAIGWPADKKPIAIMGTKVTAFAKGLDHPRWLYVLPNGDVLVAETNARTKSDDEKGLEGWITGAVKQRTGANVPSANRISLLRDTDGDGIADVQTILLEKLNSPFGMALVKNNLYVANSDAILRFSYNNGSYRVFASGLRNPNGMAWEPNTGALWTVVNERDELGNDLVPDYLTSVQDGAFYGWPYSYFGQHLDPRVSPQRPDLVAKAIAPDYALGSHIAALGLVESSKNSLIPALTKGMFIGLHGSWNRNPPSGYKVIFVPFNNGQPYGQPINVLTGFLSKQGDAYGRPVGVAMDSTGALLVADDVGNMIWRVSKANLP